MDWAEKVVNLDNQDDDGKWPDDVVYQIYCNDDLKTLDVPILNQMVNHINNIIASKEAK